MSGKIDYKNKYQELKARFMSAVDSAWNDGYQNGTQSAQLEQAAQQQAQSDQMAMAANAQPQPGQEDQASEEQTEGDPQSGQPTSQNPNGDELDQHIAKLEGMLGKAEIAPFELQDLKKTLNDIRSLQVQISLSKSMDSIKNTKMGRPSRAPLTITPKLQANLAEPSKKALSLQESIVKNVFKKWESDEKKASSEISSILNVEGITKK